LPRVLKEHRAVAFGKCLPLVSHCDHGAPNRVRIRPRCQPLLDVSIVIAE
jgi:hypothetical protein